jgi:hypothetical protein
MIIQDAAHANICAISAIRIAVESIYSDFHDFSHCNLKNESGMMNLATDYFGIRDILVVIICITLNIAVALAWTVTMEPMMILLVKQRK